jgi:hypothetical protein
MRHSGFSVEIGQRADEIFPQQVTGKIKHVLSSAKACRIESYDSQGIHCNLGIYPLSGRFLRKGVVITLCPNSSLDPLKTN